MATSRDVVAAIRDVVGDNFAQTWFNADEDPKPPYILFRQAESYSEYASDKTWIRRGSYLIALCTLNRDRSLEDALINALTAHGILIKDDGPDPDFENRIYQYLILTDPVREVYD